jgi:Putative Actinobacterial Holin-X, holin superfamily III
MASTERDRGIWEIVVDLLSQSASLARCEGQLARAEMSEKIGRIATGLGLVVGGAVLLIPALVIILQALVALLVSAGLKVWQASFAMGGAALVVGLILFALGAARLRASRLVPARTLQQLRRDAAMAVDEMRSEDAIRVRAA